MAKNRANTPPQSRSRAESDPGDEDTFNEETPVGGVGALRHDSLVMIGVHEMRQLQEQALPVPLPCNGPNDGEPRYAIPLNHYSQIVHTPAPKNSTDHFVIDPALMMTDVGTNHSQSSVVLGAELRPKPRPKGRAALFMASNMGGSRSISATPSLAATSELSSPSPPPSTLTPRETSFDFGVRVSSPASLQAEEQPIPGNSPGRHPKQTADLLAQLEAKVVQGVRNRKPSAKRIENNR